MSSYPVTQNNTSLNCHHPKTQRHRESSGYDMCAYQSECDNKNIFHLCTVQQIPYELTFQEMSKQSEVSIPYRTCHRLMS